MSLNKDIWKSNLSPKRSLGDILCLLRFLLWLSNVVCETYYFCSVIYYITLTVVGWCIVILRFFFTVINYHMAPKRSLWDITFALFLIIIIIIIIIILFIPLSAQLCPSVFSETLWNLVGISYAMWSCVFKGWFFQNGCRCHGNGQNAKK